MAYVHQLFHQTHDRFKGVVCRMSELTGKAKEWFRSWGYPPPTLTAEGYGRKCADVENYFELIDLYERGMRGAGVYLATLIYNEIQMRHGLHLTESEKVTKHKLLKETTDAFLKMDAKELEDMRMPELRETNFEIDEAIEALFSAKSRVTLMLKEKELEHSRGAKG